MTIPEILKELEGEILKSRNVVAAATGDLHGLSQIVMGVSNMSTATAKAVVQLALHVQQLKGEVASGR